MESEAKTSKALVAFMEARRILKETGPNLEKDNFYKGLMHLSVMVEDTFKKVSDLEKEVFALTKKFP
jgi:hypothetical protein